MKTIAGEAPPIALNNGIRMPALGLGTLARDALDRVASAVESAIADGYRLIDTAASYRSERPVGEALARSGIDRSEIFVTTKLWLTDYGYERTLRAFDSSLRRLGLDYLDLYLLHWPMPSDFDKTVGSYRAMTKLLAEGRVRAIGVSNFSAKHLETLIERTGVVPAVNQLELHPFFIQRDSRDTNSRLGIVTQSWSPLGNSVRSFSDPQARKDPLAHPTVVGLARTHRKTPAQIVLRWHIQHGLSAIPKSVRPEHIAENTGIFDFMLTAEDVAAIDALDTGKRSGPNPEVVDAKTFSFKIED